MKAKLGYLGYLLPTQFAKWKLLEN